MRDPYAPMLSETARRVAEAERRLRDAETVENGYSMGDAIGTMIGFPGVRAAWPFSSVNESSAVMDASGQGRTLASGGNSWGIENQIVRYAGLNGTTQYFSRADEAGLESSGALTVGGWFYANAHITTNQHMIAKANATGNQFSYRLLFGRSGLGNRISFNVCADGNPANEVGASDPSAYTPAAWTFVAGRFTPSTEAALFVNKNKFTNTTAIPAAIFNASAAFTVGARSELTEYLAGRATLLFLCAEALPDALIRRFYHITRSLLGV